MQIQHKSHFFTLKSRLAVNLFDIDVDYDISSSIADKSFAPLAAQHTGTLGVFGLTIWELRVLRIGLGTKNEACYGRSCRLLSAYSSGLYFVAVPSSLDIDAPNPTLAPSATSDTSKRPPTTSLLSFDSKRPVCLLIIPPVPSLPSCIGFFVPEASFTLA
ncbi:hypothetical protein D9758_008683 [Tetrapyrgos nigripes]|uniref:Uncharacterized protein n=1 Tax=Tetrapyrgos nigripes TaxID=182062 RepID=A0A8H5FYR9_9AGAR|nr:hypothetical protein D9758_008683 [Tetrapyrgos nigripes]